MKKLQILFAFVLLAGTLGCSDDTAGPGAAREPEVIATISHGMASSASGSHSTYGEFEFTLGLFENPRTGLTPDYTIFDGFSYDPGDAGRKLVIDSANDDPHFTEFVELLTDGETHTMSSETERLGGSRSFTMYTDGSVAKAAELETEDFTGMDIRRFELTIESLQIYYDDGRTIVDVKWRVDIIGYRN